MKNLLFLGCFLFLSLNYFAQSDAPNYKKPEFNGNREGFYKYLNKYITYPAEDREKGIRELNLEATVYINKEGKVKFVNVVGPASVFKTEVKKLLTLMPDWNAGLLNGLAVDTFVTQKIWFSTDDSRVKKDSAIYEYLIYQKALSDKEEIEWSKAQKEKEEKLKPAKELYNKAAEEFNKGGFAEAARLFDEARKGGMDTKDLYFNLAVAQLKSGDNMGSCSNFKEAARKGDPEAYGLYLKMCK